MSDIQRSNASQGYVVRNQDKPNAGVSKKTSSKSSIVGVRRIVRKELLPFTQKLSSMLDAGIPILQSLDSLVEQTQHKGMAALIQSLYDQINSGTSFSESLRKYPAVFNDLYVSTIEAGENSGNLSLVVERLAEYMEEAADLRRKVVSAMMYPTIVIFAACIITTILIIFVVPSFAGIFADFNSELPAPTQMLIDLSDLVREYWYMFILAFVAMIVAFKVAMKNENVRLSFNRWIMKAPMMIGQLVTMIIMARFSRTFASLTSSGLPLLKSLELVGRSSGNAFVAKRMSIVRGMIETGSTLTEAMTHVKIFPKMMLQMVKTGEESARIDHMLNKMAEYYEKETKSLLDGLSSIIEPILMLVVGTIVGFIAFAMFMPIFELGGAVLNS